MTTATRLNEKLKTNTTYIIRVRAKNSIGQWGDLSDTQFITTDYDTTAPAVLSSITLLMLAGMFQLKWSKPSTLDLRGGGFKIYVYTANTPASAVLIREVGYTADSAVIVIGEKSQDASITITAGTTYYFWVTTLDDSGNESAKVATTPGSGSVSAAGVSTFLGLTDTPAAYTGEAGKFPKVNAGENALEFAVLAGGGDVLGPATSVDNSIARFNGTDNKTIQDSAVILTDGGLITPRITTIVSNANPTINTDNCDAVTITAQAADIASMTTNLSGTPVNFQKLIIRIKDDGTARAITWGAKFVAKGVALPTTTVISKLLTVGFIYDTVATTWGCVASVQET